jgi:CheY-like chemotaxis protein
MVRYRIYSTKKYELSDLSELNLIERILAELNSQLSYQYHKQVSEFWFGLPLTDQQNSYDESQTILGNSHGMPILLSVKRSEPFVDVLSNHNQLIFENFSLQNVKKHRPRLVVVQFNQDDPYQLDSLSEIKQQFPNLAVILVIDNYHKSELVQFIRKGVSDYLVEPVLNEELQLRVQTALRHSEIDTSTTEIVDVREVTVQLVRTCVQFWQSLPKNPRWDTVGRTASFVLEECPLNEKDRQDISEQLKQFNQLLSV